MGTNYYIKIKKCESCGHDPERIHLGKSSYGWRFKLQYNNGEFYKNIEDMKKWLVDKKIFDEDGVEITPKQFWSMVETKQKEKKENIKDFGFDLDGYEFIDGYFS